MGKGNTVVVNLIGDASKLSGALNDAEGKLKNFGSKIGTVLKGGALAGGAAAAALLVKGFGDALDQQRLSDKLSAQLGLANEDAKRAGDIAGSLYADAYGDSFAHVNEALAAIANSGLANLHMITDETAAGIEGLTANALDLASAFDMDVNEVIQSAGYLLKNGLVNDAEDAMDSLAFAFQSMSPLIRDEVIAASEEYSTFLGDLGITANEAFAIMGKAAETGGKYGVDKVGDALKELPNMVRSMSDDTAEAFEAIGISGEDMARRIVSGGDVARDALSELTAALSGVADPAEKGRLAVRLFGTPLEDLSDSEIPKVLEALAQMDTDFSHIEGSAEALGDALNDNLATKIESFKRTVLQGLTDFIEEKVLPVIEKMAPHIAQAWEDLQPFFDDLRDTIVEAWDDIQPKVEDLVEAMGDFFDALDESGTLETFNSLFGALVDAVTAFGEVALPILEAFFDLMATDAAQDELQRLTGELEEAADALALIFSGTSSLLSGDWEDFITEYKDETKLAVDVVQFLFGEQSVKLPEEFRKVKDNAGPIWSEFWSNTTEKTSQAAEKVGTVVGKLPGLASQKFNEVKNAVQPIWSSTWESVSSKVSEGYNTVSSVVGKVPGLLSSKFSEARSAVAGIWSNMWASVQAKARAGIDGVIRFFSGMPAAIRRFISAVANAARDIGAAIGRSFISGVRDTISSGLKSLGGLAKGVVSAAARVIPIPSFESFAQGGVVASPRLAIVGDAGPGNPEIVTPESLMRDIVRSELAAVGGAMTAQTANYTGGSDRPLVVQLNIDGQTVAQQTFPSLRRMLFEDQRRNGSTGLVAS